MQNELNQEASSDTILLLSYGNVREYRRTLLLLNSILAHWRPGENNRWIRIATDSPEFFTRHLPDCPLDFDLLEPARLSQLRGRLDFIHLVKIGVIESALRARAGKLLYLDSDTFMISSPSTIFQRISPDRPVFHTKEYSLASLHRMEEPKHKYFGELLLNQDYRNQTIEGKSLSGLYSWNAGVLGLSKAHETHLPAVVSLAEQFYETSGHHASEQYAFSVVFQTKFTLGTCEDEIFHYWSDSLKLMVDTSMQTVDWTADSGAAKSAEMLQVCRKLQDVFTGIQKRRRAISALWGGQYALGITTALLYLWQVRFRDAMFFKDLLHIAKTKIKTLLAAKS